MNVSSSFHCWCSHVLRDSLSSLTRTTLTTTRVLDTAHRSSPPSPRSEGHASTSEEPRAKEHMYTSTIYPAHGSETLSASFEVLPIAINPFTQRILAFPLHRVQASNEQLINTNHETIISGDGNPLGHPGIHVEPCLIAGDCEYILCLAAHQLNVTTRILPPSESAVNSKAS